MVQMRITEESTVTLNGREPTKSCDLSVILWVQPSSQHHQGNGLYYTAGDV